MLTLISIWLILDAIGFVLLFLRKDAHIILEEVVDLVVRPFPFSILSFIVLLMALPTTIPYSLLSIFKNDDTE